MFFDGSIFDCFLCVFFAIGVAACVRCTTKSSCGDFEGNHACISIVLFFGMKVPRDVNSIFHRYQCLQHCNFEVNPQCMLMVLLLRVWASAMRPTNTHFWFYL